VWQCFVDLNQKLVLLQNHLSECQTHLSVLEDGQQQNMPPITNDKALLPPTTTVT